MKGLVREILNRPVTVIVTIIALVVFFITSMSSITLKMMPDMSIPIMAVYTIYPGATPEEVDELVSDKISSAVESISGIKAVMCESYEGMSYVILQYEYGKDMHDAYNDVREAVDGIRPQLPTDIKEPTVLEIDTSAIDDVTLSVTGNSENVDVLAEVNQYVIPELKKVSTLAQTNVSGGDEKYIRIQVMPEYLYQYGLDLTAIANAIAAANFSMPAGTADYGDQVLQLASEVKYDTLPKLEQVPISTSKGQTIHLNDIATVQYAVSDKTSMSRYMGESNVSIGIKRKQSASSVTLSRQLKPVLEKLREKYPELNIVVVEDMADTIISTLKGVGKTMVEAIFLAMFIIFIFFGDLKGSLIVGSTMPVSIMATVICMHMAGFALDIITMAALIIAIGMMTDNAVVVIEMCFRRHQAGLSFKEAAYEGTTIVINAVIGSTLTTMVVYLPLAVMKGLSGQMFKPLGSTIIFALLSSLISAITLIPLCFSIYKPVEKREIITNRILKKLSKVYRKVLRFALKWKKTVFVVAIALLVFTGYLATFLKTELFSGTDEGIANISITFRPNLSLEAMDGTVRQVEEFVKGYDDVKSFSTIEDRSDSLATISAYKKEDSSYTTQQLVDEWNEKLKGFSNICEINVSTGSTMGMGSMSAVSTEEFDITSADLDKLKETSNKIIEIMEDTDGVLYANSNYNETGTKAMVEIDPVLATARGFSPQQLAGLVYANMSGKKACEVTIDNKKYEVNVRYPEDYFKDVSDVASMTFTNSKGVSVPLSEVGSVKFVSAPQAVYRQDGLYVDFVKATMTAATRDEVAEKLHEKIDDMEMDPDVGFLDDTVSKMMEEEFSALGMAIFIAIFLVFFVMAVQFESIADAILIMLCIPFSGIGAILFLLIMNIKISMVSLMGILMLSGIVVNNGIILIDMAIQNQKKGMDTVEALVDAGSGRLRPILMTTMTTVMAMIPVSLGWSKDAMAMQGMAGVLVGGLSASTLLTLILLPTFYLLLDRTRAKITARSEKRKNKLEQKVVEEEKRLKEKEKENARINIVFPMAGAGTRFLKDGYDMPKPLIKMAGEPFFVWAVDSLLGHVKVGRMVFVVLKEHVEKYEIDKRIREYYPAAKIVQLDKVLPGALLTAMEGAKTIKNDNPVIFMDCDLLFTSEKMYDYYNTGAFGADGTLLTFKSDLDKYSYVKTDDNGYAKETAEKKVISDHAIAGAYGFSNAAEFLEAAKEYIKNCPYDEFYMSGIYNVLIKKGLSIKVFDVDEYESFGTPEEFIETEKKLNAKLEGKTVITEVTINRPDTEEPSSDSGKGTGKDADDSSNKNGENGRDVDKEAGQDAENSNGKAVDNDKDSGKDKDKDAGDNSGKTVDNDKDSGKDAGRSEGVEGISADEKG